MKLKSGDKVALVAPASGQKKSQQLLIDKAIDVLSSWGLVVTIIPSLVVGSRYLAATDTMRANSLISALTHPEIKAIFTTRGGYGCARLLPYLSDSNIHIPSPRMLLGFSDITTLHLHFTRKKVKNLHCVHAPNLSTGQFLDDKHAAMKNQQALYQFLFEDNISGLGEYLAASGDAQLEAVTDDWKTQQKTGGCLSLLVTSLGTLHEIDTTNKWLFIEEVGETPYKIDRMLTHLKNAGKLDNVRGVVLGDFVSCSSENINVEDVVSEFFDELSCPLVKLPCWGHGDINVPWLYS